MPARIPMRADFTANDLRKLAAESSDARQSRRLLSLAAIADGMSRGDAARIGPKAFRNKPEALGFWETQQHQCIGGTFFAKPDSGLTKTALKAANKITLNLQTPAIA